MLEYLRGYEGEKYICHTPDGLLKFLQKHGGGATTETGFPANTRALGRELTRIAPELTARGIIIEAARDRDYGRLWTIATEEDYRPAPTASRLKAERRRIYGHGG
jgi:hypothetical protein